MSVEHYEPKESAAILKKAVYKTRRLLQTNRKKMWRK